jgi:biopolymer transport protein ExbB/TolQ
MRWAEYGIAAAMLVLALLFPIGLMVFNPTLMFERGWEQYVGTGIYLWAVLTLSRELLRLWLNERAFREAPDLLKRVNIVAARKAAEPAGAGPGTGAGSTAPAEVSDDERRILPRRVRQLASYIRETRSPSMTQLMEVNREASGLDQEQVAGRFTLTRYILYLLPVIGFIGTVEGISRALMKISEVLPMVKELDGFLSNLTGVTAALQIAFDSTLLALFLSAALMLVQTLVFRCSEELLARVDRWVVEHVLPKVGGDDHPVIDRLAEVIGPRLDAMTEKLARVLEPSARSLTEQAEKLGASLRAPIAEFTASVQRLPEALASFRQGADTIGRIGADLEAIGTAGESLHRGVASLARIEEALAQASTAGAQLEDIRRGLERTGSGIESLATSWSAAYERSSRATQEQLARSLTSLKDALELLNVSMEQGNALYRNIVKKLFDERLEAASAAGATTTRTDTVRAA